MWVEWMERITLCIVHAGALKWDVIGNLIVSLLHLVFLNAVSGNTNIMRVIKCVGLKLSKEERSYAIFSSLYVMRHLITSNRLNKQGFRQRIRIKLLKFWLWSMCVLFIIILRIMKRFDTSFITHHHHHPTDTNTIIIQFPQTRLSITSLSDASYP
jgi:hypothetical protein